MGQGLQLPWSIDCGEKDVTWLLGVGYKWWYSFCLALIFRTLALGTQEGKPQSHGERMCRCSDQLHRLLNIWVSEPLDDSRLWAATADAKWNRGKLSAMRPAQITDAQAKHGLSWFILLKFHMHIFSCLYQFLHQHNMAKWHSVM